MHARAGEYNQGTGQLLIEPVAGMIRSIATDSRRLLTCPQSSRLPVQSSPYLALLRWVTWGQVNG